MGTPRILGETGGGQAKEGGTPGRRGGEEARSMVDLKSNSPARECGLLGFPGVWLGSESLKQFRNCSVNLTAPISAIYLK